MQARDTTRDVLYIEDDEASYTKPTKRKRPPATGPRAAECHRGCCEAHWPDRSGWRSSASNTACDESPLLPSKKHGAECSFGAVQPAGPKSAVSARRHPSCQSGGLARSSTRREGLGTSPSRRYQIYPHTTSRDEASIVPSRRHDLQPGYGYYKSPPPCRPRMVEGTPSCLHE